MTLFRLGLFLGLVAVAAGRVTAQEAPDAGAGRARQAFVAAYERARAGRLAIEEDSQALQSYVLYPYLQAARLAQGLTRAGEPWSETDEEVRGFLAFFDGEPVGWSLRYTWLKSLARRRQWQAFLDHFREDVADDELYCDYLAARVERGALEGLQPLIVERYLTPHQLPIQCEPVFQWLRAQGGLTDDMIEQRVRLLLENRQSGFARVIAGRLPEARAARLLRWADLLDRPAAAFDEWLDAPVSGLEPPIALDAWEHFTRNAPAAALDRYAGLVAALDLDPAAASPFARALALGLAWDRRPESREYFARIGARDLDDYALGWQARAALWAGDFALARASIAAMSVGQRGSSDWRYWAARVSEDRDERERLFESTLSDDNFYSALSAARLRERAAPHQHALPRDEARVAAIAARAPFVRAFELLAVGLPVAAVREWRHGYRTLGEQDRIQAIHLALAREWFDLGVATATQHGVFDDYALLYPTPYRREVEAAAGATGLEPELIFAVIRQESLYRADAVSAAGARGLMQLRPGTAERVRGGLALRGRSNLLDPGVNVALGSAELARLLERYDGQLVVALAAYNAGPAAVDRWLPEAPIDADIWIENIPYNETREYVRRVLWHRVVFGWLESGRGVDARDWLEPVRPRDETR